MGHRKCRTVALVQLASPVRFPSSLPQLASPARFPNSLPQLASKVDQFNRLKPGAIILVDVQTD